MAIGPDDLGLSQEELDVVLKIERHLDEGLRKFYIPGVSFFYSLNEIPEVSFESITSRILGEVLIRYRDVGWSEFLIEMGDGLILRGELDRDDFPELEYNEDFAPWNIAPIWPPLRENLR
jgi:hypothetical protein